MMKKTAHSFCAVIKERYIMAISSEIRSILNDPELLAIRERRMGELTAPSPSPKGAG